MEECSIGSRRMVITWKNSTEKSCICDVSFCEVSVARGEYQAIKVQEQLTDGGGEMEMCIDSVEQ